MRNRFFLTVAMTLLSTSTMTLAASKSDFLMYVGTYTGKGSDGIYVYRFDAKTGTVKPIGLAAKADNPSFLAISPDEKSLYSVSEVGRGAVVSAFDIDAQSGMLKLRNAVADPGSGPCFVGVDHTGKVVVIANYGSGSVASYQVGADGKLSPAVSMIQHKGSSADPARQKGPHAHSINVSPDNRFAIAADLGLDELLVYKLDAASGQLTPNDPPFTKVTPGDGPRHFTFHPNKRFAYVIAEMHNTVTALNWDAAKGTLTPIESVSTLPPDFKGASDTAEVQVHQNGKWLYGSNRGHDSIAVFDIDQKTGKLKLVQNAPTGGSHPRNFRMDPTGNWLIAANMNGNSMKVFKIDQTTGQLTASGDMLKLTSPVCIKFIPAK